MIVQFLMHEISKFNEAIEGRLKKSNVVNLFKSANIDNHANS